MAETKRCGSCGQTCGVAPNGKLYLHQKPGGGNCPGGSETAR